MIKQIIVDFYCLPLIESCTLVILGICLWYVLMRFLNGKEKLRKVICGFVALASIFLVIAATLFSRQQGEHSACFIPFRFLWNRTRDWDTTLRPMIMNIILFVPIGISVPFLFKNQSRLCRNTIIVFVIMFLISAALEATQLLLRVGTFETDDILCNLLGAALGMLPYQLLHRFYQSHKGDEVNAN